LLALGAVSILLALRAVRSGQHTPLNRAGAWLIIAGAVWTMCYAMELGSASLAAKVFWAKAAYVGIVALPVFWLVYTLRYAGHEAWLTRRGTWLLVALSLLMLGLVFTTEWHGLVWTQATMVTDGRFGALDQDFGPGFWVFLFYANVLTVGGFVVLAHRFIQLQRLHRSRIRVLLFAVLLMGLAISLDTLGLVPLGGLDLAPLVLALLTSLVAWRLFRLQHDDIVPVVYESIFRGLEDCVLVLDEQDRLLVATPAARALMGEVPTEVVGLPVASVWPEWRACEASADGKTGGRWEWTRDLGDCRRCYTVTVSPVQDAMGVVVSRIITLYDITEHKEAEREILERRSYLEGVLEAAPDAIVTLDTQHRVVEWNSAAETLFGYSAEEAIGQDVDQLIVGPDVLEEAQGFTRQSLRGEYVAPTETIRYRKDGSPVHLVGASSPIVSDQGTTGTVVVYADISGRKRMERELRALNEELEQRVADRTARLSQMNDELVRAVGEHERAQDELLRRNRELLSLQSAIAATASSLDLSFLLDTVTWEMSSLLGVERCTVMYLDPQTSTLSVLASHGDSSGDGSSSEQFYSLAQYPTRRQVLDERSARQMTVGQSHVDQKEREYMREAGIKCLLMQPMVFQDRVVGLLEVSDSRSEHVFSEQEISLAQLFANQAAGAIENARLYERAQNEIAERLRAEEQITASLREKEVLLKEIHHRVKNNLQVISSLLRLQSREIEDQDILEIFHESQHRVRSMALIHEKLYRSEDLARVDFGSYIQDLAGFLFRSYKAEHSSIRLNVDAGGVSLPIDSAVPCGLILNELISNSLKHAFVDRQEGVIQVLLAADQNERVRLTVSDDGVGFPNSIDYQRASTLGLQLVNTLVDQLDGEIEVHSVDGTRFEIEFDAA